MPSHWTTILKDATPTNPYGATGYQGDAGEVADRWAARLRASSQEAERRIPVRSSAATDTRTAPRRAF